MKAGKVWGETTMLLNRSDVVMCGLVIQPNRRCSMHKHEHKWNGFYVSTGRLLIEVQKQDYDLVDVTELLPGQFMEVKPGEYHRFVTGDEGATGVELYYREQLSDDIIRKDVGGEIK